MWPVAPSDGLFGDAFERIWKKRIGMLKERESDLVTPELLKWESDLKKAFQELEIYQNLTSEARKRFLKCKDPPNASGKRGNDTDKTGDTVDNVNEELEIGERENRNRSNRENVEEVRGVENTEKVNEQEQEDEPSHDKGDEKVAQELKVFLLDIQRLIDHSTRREEESNNAMDQSVDVTPQPNVAKRTETENSEGTSSLKEFGLIYQPRNL